MRQHHVISGQIEVSCPQTVEQKDTEIMDEQITVLILNTKKSITIDETDEKTSERILHSLKFQNEFASTTENVKRIAKFDTEQILEKIKANTNEICDTFSNLNDDLDSDKINKENKNIQINRNVFYDKSPKTSPNDKYFICRDASNKSNLCVLIPMYNENKFAIQSTLLSLFESLETLQHLVVDILIILDGWNKADISSKIYFQQIFKFNESDITNNEHKKHKNYVFQTANFCPICFSKSSECRMNLSLMIKMENGGKHNSQEWFMNPKSGFIEAMKSDYFLLMDCFTLFDKKCLTQLFSTISSNPNISCVTGRQRVMSEKQQNISLSIFSIQYILQCYQCFDCEVSSPLENAPFDLFNFQPVIPGPCGLYRSKHVFNGNVINKYFELMNKSNASTELISGNLRLVEDRLLPYTVILSNADYKMKYVSTAVFYYDPQLTLKSFLLQRRRWINGQFAGFIHLFNLRKRIKNKFVLVLACLHIYLNLCVCFFLPGYIIGLFYVSLSDLFPSYPIISY
eukprot:385056_1